jgi:hypothetical protein
MTEGGLLTKDFDETNTLVVSFSINDLFLEIIISYSDAICKGWLCRRLFKLTSNQRKGAQMIFKRQMMLSFFKELN